MQLTCGFFCSVWWSLLLNNGVEPYPKAIWNILISISKDIYLIYTFPIFWCYKKKNRHGIFWFELILIVSVDWRISLCKIIIFRDIKYNVICKNWMQQWIATTAWQKGTNKSPKIQDVIEFLFKNVIRFKL